jgi:hypothetical protein
MPEYARNIPEVCSRTSRDVIGKVDFHRVLGHFKSQFESFPLFLASRNAQKCPEMPRNVPKCPKTCTKTPGVIFENIVFWRFFDLYDPFSVIFGSGRVLKGLQKWHRMPKNAKKCQKTAKKHVHIARITHQMDRNPQKSCWKKMIFDIILTFCQNNLSRKLVIQA